MGISQGKEMDMVDYSDRKGDWLITFTGKRFYPLDPREEDIDIVDIAHSLSLLNRFNGHTEFPYSVAQHSIKVSYLVDPQFALDGLLHDATETYVNDLPRPLKRNLQDYRAVEDGIHEIISSKFDVCTNSDMVKGADAVALVTEAQWMCHGEQWYYDSHWPSPAGYKVFERNWRDVQDEFLDRFEELYYVSIG